MKTNCINCGELNPKHRMKMCSRKCTDEYKSKQKREKRKCLMCDHEFEVRKKEERQLCSHECRKSWALTPENRIKRAQIFKDSVKSKYGVENIFQLKEFQDKARKVKIEKYGDVNYNNASKMVETKKERYGNGYFKKFFEDLKSKCQNEHGVDHYLKLPFYKEKLKQTSLEKYGVENVSQNETCKEKRTNTMIERFGVENASQNDMVKLQKKLTSLENFGVSHHLKDYDMFQKHQRVQFKTKQYKDTELTYQGSYELYFLEQMELKGLLGEVGPGKSYKYSIGHDAHMYHTDFFFRGQNIEIKSNWTYNKNGADQELQLLNEVKWQAVRDFGDKLIILIEKGEINGFIKSLS